MDEAVVIEQSSGLDSTTTLFFAPTNLAGDDLKETKTKTETKTETEKQKRGRKRRHRTPASASKTRKTIPVLLPVTNGRPFVDFAAAHAYYEQVAARVAPILRKQIESAGPWIPEETKAALEARPIRDFVVAVAGEVVPLVLKKVFMDPAMPRFVWTDQQKVAMDRAMSLWGLDSFIAYQGLPENIETLATAPRNTEHSPAFIGMMNWIPVVIGGNEIVFDIRTRLAALATVASKVFYGDKHALSPEVHTKLRERYGPDAPRCALTNRPLKVGDPVRAVEMRFRNPDTEKIYSYDFLVGDASIEESIPIWTAMSSVIGGETVSDLAVFMIQTTRMYKHLRNQFKHFLIHVRDTARGASDHAVLTKQRTRRDPGNGGASGGASGSRPVVLKTMRPDLIATAFMAWDLATFSDLAIDTIFDLVIKYHKMHVVQALVFRLLESAILDQDDRN